MHWLINTKIIYRYAYLLFFLSLILLFSVEIIGVLGKGASRWIKIFGFSIQPSELIKVTIIVALAKFYNDYIDIIKFLQVIFNVRRYNFIEKLVNDLSLQMIDKFNFQYMKISITKQIDANCNGITVEQETCNEWCIFIYW